MCVKVGMWLRWPFNESFSLILLIFKYIEIIILQKLYGKKSCLRIRICQISLALTWIKTHFTLKGERLRGMQMAWTKKKQKTASRAVCSRERETEKPSRKQSLSHRSKWSPLQSPVNSSFVYTSGLSRFGNHTSVSLYWWIWPCCYQSDFKLWFMQLLVFEVLFGLGIQPFFPFLSFFFFSCSNNILSKSTPQNL